MGAYVTLTQGEKYPVPDDKLTTVHTPDITIDDRKAN